VIMRAQTKRLWVGRDFLVERTTTYWLAFSRCCIDVHVISRIEPVGWSGPLFPLYPPHVLTRGFCVLFHLLYVCLDFSLSFFGRDSCLLYAKRWCANIFVYIPRIITTSTLFRCPLFFLPPRHLSRLARDTISRNIRHFELYISGFRFITSIKKFS